MSNIDFTKFIPKAAHADFEEYQDRIRKDESRTAVEDASKVVEAFSLRDDVVEMLRSGSLKPSQARSDVEDWRKALPDGKRPLLALLGPCGTGKTVAAAEAAYVHKNFRYVRSQKVALMARAMFGPGVEAYDEMLRTPALLVVDEVGFERDRESARLSIHELIDHRKTSKRPTVLISNLTSKEFSEAFDARTIDRMREYGTIVELHSKSLRGEGA